MTMTTLTPVIDNEAREQSDSSPDPATDQKIVSTQQEHQQQQPQHKVPFPLLPGECVIGREKITEGKLILTNYRFYIQAPKSSKSDWEKCYSQLPTDEHLVNIPVGAIDSVEIRDIQNLLITTKYVQTILLSFSSVELATLWLKRFTDANQLKIDSNFCFKFAQHYHDVDDYYHLKMLNSEEQNFLLNSRQFVVKEFKRMGFDSKHWRICELNREFRFSHSYPPYFIVPYDTTDKELEFVANFRYSKRVPAVVWRSQRNGCVILRSSQPVVGWFNWRSNQDERLLQKVINVCNRDVSHYKLRRRKNNSDCSKENGTTHLSNGDRPNGNGNCKYSDIESPNLENVEPESNDNDANVNEQTNMENGHVPNGNGHANRNTHFSNEGSRLLILDARSYAAALANRAMGGGAECAEYYNNCEVQFMGLANIHSVRKSFHSLRYLCEASQIDQQNWFTQIDNTKWFHYLSALLKCAVVIVDSITIQERPVLVHCSDGWDRTPQVVSLAELMLDPYYRTIDGFKALVKREWCDFGHKFADRCRSTTLNVDLNERCPVFLQWLDCVHQLLRQSPEEFEFNETFLVKLVHHTYSGLFGTFICNNVQERITELVYEKTVSFWAYIELEKEKFKNYLYMPNQEVLRASSRVKDLLLWNDVYIPVQSSRSGNIPETDPIPNGITSQEDECEESEYMNQKSKSLFVSRSAEFVSQEGASNALNEADIDESNIDLQAPPPIVSGLSQSKSDLTRATSLDSLNKLKFDSPSLQKKISVPNSSTCEFDAESRLRVRHLSDSYLYDPNKMPIDRDQFLSPSRDDLNEERPISEKISDDSSCDDNASAKNERRSVEERFCDGGLSPKPNPAEMFGIDGELLKDKTNTQIIQMINCHKRMINSLTLQMQNNRLGTNNHFRAHRVYSPEDRSRKSYVYKQNQELLDNLCNGNLNGNSQQFESNGFY